MLKIEVDTANVSSRLMRVWRALRRRPKTSIAVGIVILLIVMLILWLRTPKAPEYITAEAVQGDLRQVVEAVGEVISERDMKLQFPITGVVEAVNVEEGNDVAAGQELARLRSSGLAADVNSASAQVASAKAELTKLEEGTRPEEIAITEASVANKRAALEAARETLRSAERTLETSEVELDVLRDEARTSLQGYVSTAKSDISLHLSTALTAVRVMDDVFENNALLDVFIRHEPGIYDLERRRINEAQALIQAALSSSASLREHQEAIAALEDARRVVANLADGLTQIYGAVAALPITPAFSNADREASKADIAAERSSVQSALSSLDTSIKTLRDASAGFDTRIATKEASVSSTLGTRDKALADIQTFQTSLRIEEAQLSLQRAGSRQSDIDAARGRLNQAYATLQRARERYEDTIIRAPIDGVITKVDLKEGELLSTAFASDAAITMLGNAPYRIEMYIAEIDIPKVQLSQSGSIELDAFPDELFDLVVTELDPAATNVDGVSKYRAKLDFSNQAEALRIGMTGDAEIYTNFRSDVVIIPGRAVYTGEDGRDHVRILGEDEEVEERRVEVGMDGEGGDREIMAGVKPGETVVVLIKD